MDTGRPRRRATRRSGRACHGCGLWPMTGRKPEGRADARMTVMPGALPVERRSRSRYKSPPLSAGARVTPHYHVLKVASDAPIEVIRAAYRVLAARHHPDRCAGDPAALRRMQQVNEAYRVLSDPGLRAAHDAALRRERRRRVSDGEPVAAARTDHGPAPTASASAPAALRRRAAAIYTAHADIGGRRSG